MGAYYLRRVVYIDPLMAITIVQPARVGFAEVVRHDGPDACRIGNHPYEDHSRNSKVCSEHRAEYQKMIARAAHAKQNEKRKAARAARSK